MIADLEGNLVELAACKGEPAEFSVRLFCASHEANHLVRIQDVERIVYTLAFMVPVAYAGLVGSNHPHPDCPLDVLKTATDRNYYQQPVDDLVLARAGAGEWTS